MHVVCEYLYVHISTARTPSWHQRVLSSSIFMSLLQKSPINGVIYRSHLQKSLPKIGMFSKRDLKFVLQRVAACGSIRWPPYTFSHPLGSQRL